MAQHPTTMTLRRLAGSSGRPDPCPEVARDYEGFVVGLIEMGTSDLPVVTDLSMHAQLVKVDRYKRKPRPKNTFERLALRIPLV